MVATLTTINLLELQESKQNTRKDFNKAALEELTASIREKGVINPLLVRRVNSHFEIVAGARRFRAAKAAGLSEIPAIVRELTDEEAAEIMIVDNLQREGVHPLDEAEGYERLLKSKNGDVKAVAAKVGKSASYIYGRLALANLTEHSKKAYLAGRMELGHALLVAKLQPDEQKMAVNEEIGGRAASIEELKRYIRDELMLDLSSAPWKWDDVALLSRAGSCTACPKRTGKNPELFQDFGKGDKCLDGKCFQGKMQAFLIRKRLELKKAGLPVKDISLGWGNYGRDKSTLYEQDYRAWKGCDKPVMGLVVEGKDLGTTKKICLTPDCKKCNPGRSVDHRDFARQTGPERYKRRMEIWGNKIQQELRTRLRKEVVPTVKGPVKRWHLLALLRETMDASRGVSFEDAGKLVGVKWPDMQRIYSGDDLKQAEHLLAKASDDQILRFIFAIATERDMIADPSLVGSDIELLTPLIDLHAGNKIDTKAIEAQVRKELESKKPKPPKKDSVKKSSKKAKPKAKGKKK